MYVTLHRTMGSHDGVCALLIQLLGIGVSVQPCAMPTSLLGLSRTAKCKNSRRPSRRGFPIL
jgi:hypothetical protein